MKKNLPILDEEYPVPAGISIVSKTDLRGVVTYINDAFVTVSGFDTTELIGKSHNLVRHPDMPRQVFADMWRTLKSGQPWKGIVKNRRKDGRYYWVNTCVVPIRKEDETIGYMSVRQNCSAAEIATARVLYEKLRQSGAAIPRQKLTNLLTIRTGFALGSLFVVLMMIAGCLLGVGGLRLSNASVETLYQDLLNPVSSVGRISYLLADARSTLLVPPRGAKLALRVPLKDENLASTLATSRDEIDRLLEGIGARPLAVSDRQALVELKLKYKTLTERALIPLEEGLLAGIDANRLNLLTSRAMPLFREATQASSALEHRLLSSAAHNYEDMRDRNQLIWRIAIAGVLFGIAMVLLVGRFFLRDTVKPLDDAIRAFDRIAQGDLSHEVRIDGRGETGQLIRSSVTMQMHLKAMMDELALVTDRLYTYTRYQNHALQGVSEHSDEQHDRVYQAKDAVDLAAHEAASVSLDVEGLLAALEAVKAVLPTDAPTVSGPLAHLESQIATLATTLRVQAFAADDIAVKMNQIASLIVENRKQTQEAYGISERVRHVADELKSLVSYFENRQPEDCEPSA